MEKALEHKQNDANIGLRVILCLGGVCVWLYAAYFALKWLGHIARGTISYGSETAAILLPILSILVFAGAIGSIAAAVMTFSGKIKLRWQVIIFCAGLIVLWAIAGN